MWRRRKLAKKRLYNWGKMLWLVPVFLVIALIFLVVKSGMFNIKQVTVTAEALTCTDSDKIKNSVNLLGQNILLVNSKQIETAIKSRFYCVRSTPLQKILPDKVRLKVAGRKPVAAIALLKEKEASLSALINVSTPSAKAVSEIFQVDDEGVIFAKEANGLNVPKIYVSDSAVALGRKMSGNLVNNALRVLAKIKELRLEVKDSWIFDNFFVAVVEPSKMKIIVRLNDRLDYQLASLQLILDKAKIDLKELEFIDLRFDKPVVKVAPKK